MEIAEAVQCFAQAVQTQDMGMALTACTRDGWIGAGDSAQALFQVLLGRRLSLHPRPTRLWSEGGRAAAELEVHQADKTIGLAYLLLEHGDVGWRIAGSSQHPPMVPLYLKGQMPARMVWRELPESPEANAWAQGLLERLKGEGEPMAEATEKLLGVVGPLSRSEEGQGTVQFLRSLRLTGTQRAAVGIGLHAPGQLAQERWFMLDINEAGVHPVYMAIRPEVPALLYGFPMPSPGTLDLDGLLRNLVTPKN